MTCSDEQYGLKFEFTNGRTTVKEGGELPYKVVLTADAPSSDVIIHATVVGTGCSLRPNSVINEGIFTLSTSVDSLDYKLDALSYSCVVTHTVATNDVDYKDARKLEYSIGVLSKGCGGGEYLGAEDRNGDVCICSEDYFLPPQKDCTKCPVETSVCNVRGLAAPIVRPGFWRDDPTSPDLEAQPFYPCHFEGSCLGGNATKGRCAEGYDDDGILCATCASGYVLQGQTCSSCPGRTGTNAFSGALFAVTFLGVIVFAGGTYYTLTAPALTKSDVKSLKATLKSVEGVDELLQTKRVRRQTFGRMLTTHNVVLSEVQVDQAYEAVRGRRSSSVGTREWGKFVHNKAEKVKEKAAEIKEEVGSISEVSAALEELAPKNVKLMWSLTVPVLAPIEDFSILAKQMTQSLKNHVKKIWQDFLKSVMIRLEHKGSGSLWPEDMLLDFAIKLLEPFVKFENTVLKVQGLLKDIYHMMLHRMENATALRKRLNEMMDRLRIQTHLLEKFLAEMVSTFQPKFHFMELAYHFQADRSHLVEIEKMWNSVCKSICDLIEQHLPSTTMMKLPASLLHFVTFTMPGMFEVDFGLNNANFGGWYTKLKIFLSHSQCFTYFPVTFVGIAWPSNLKNFMKLWEITSLDIFAVFGDMSCQMQTGYLQKFIFHMLLCPGMLFIIFAIYTVLKKKRCGKRNKYSPESLKSQLYNFLSLIAFTLYTGIATRIFRLFKCYKVQGTFYLTDDFTVKCFDSEWYTHAYIAFFCMALYVFGIPFVQFYVLYSNRFNLHKETCADPLLQNKLQKQYGSIYVAYRPECYYFDIADLMHRLFLTGGLILLGQDSVAQTFLGIVICAIWQSMLLYLRPYAADWDNTIAIILAVQLQLTMVSGMALQLYQSTPDQDEYEQQGFAAVLLIVAALVTVLSVGSTLVGTPCIQNTWEKWTQRQEEKKRNQIQKKTQNAERRWSGVNPNHAEVSIEMVSNPIEDSAGRLYRSR